MPKIQVLASHLIDQIAAGEVIERPFSVVKELVENAIDAGATKIFIQIQNAGKDLIQIVDNGVGMSKEDCLLAIQRHATSKLSSIEDLYQLTTMGFRGEALAAIGSISNMEITTNQDEASSGFFVRISNGKKIDSGNIGFAKGTRISVKNIFQSIPARLKFLKSNAAELQRIKDKVLCFALAHPNIEFRLLENSKMLLQFPARVQLIDRVSDCLGVHISKNLFFLNYKESYMSFEGFFSLPEYCRVNKKLQFEYINGRHIQSTQLNKAIYKGFEGMLMKQLHPIYIIYVKLAPSEVDVNVHPAKTQVQLKNHILVQTILSQQIASRIRKQTRKYHKLTKENFIQNQSSSGGTQEFPRHSSNKLFATTYTRKSSDTRANPDARANSAPSQSSRPDTPLEFQTASDTRKEALLQKNFSSEESKAISIESKKLQKAEYIRVLGIYKKYLFAQIDERFAIVDVHAAHERIRFEELKQKFLQQGKKATIPLLEPFVVEFSVLDFEKIAGQTTLFEKNGLHFQKQQDHCFLVKSIPSFLQSSKNQEQIIKNFILELVEEKENFQNIGKIQDFVNSSLQSKSCHSAIRGEQQVAQMSISEMEQMLEVICQNEMAIYCPHGRPIILFYDEKDLDKFFKRI
jgi:DNA mismatch repair protein MutL